MFKNNLKVEKVGDQVYILLEDLVYECDRFTITVKKGFDFDAISIPKVFWTLVDSPFTGRAVRGATVHDALYASQVLPKNVCDEVFLAAMKDDGVSYIKRNAMYMAVKVGGKGAYEDTEDIEKYKSLIEVIEK